MSTTATATNPTGTVRDADGLAARACHLYDAKCALHAAHQSGVEEWIAAAADKLHQAAVEYLAAIAERDATCLRRCPDRRPCDTEQRTPPTINRLRSNS